MSDKLLAVARIKAPQGLSGKMWISPLGQADKDFLSNYTQVLIGRQGAPRSVVSIVKRNRGFVLEVAGITRSEQVELLLGESIYIDRDWLPELTKDEYYTGDLVGLRVQTAEGREIGLRDRLPGGERTGLCKAAGKRQNQDNTEQRQGL